MGWASGSRIFSGIIEVLQEHVDDFDVRRDVYEELINLFEDADCDTLDEAVGEDPAFDAAW